MQKLQQIKETEMIPSLSHHDHPVPLPISTPTTESCSNSQSTDNASGKSRSRATSTEIKPLSGKAKQKLFLSIAKRFYEELYARNSQDVVQAFQNHFDFKGEPLKVKYWEEEHSRLQQELEGKSHACDFSKWDVTCVLLTCKTLFRLAS